MPNSTTLPSEQKFTGPTVATLRKDSDRHWHQSFRILAGAVASAVAVNKPLQPSTMALPDTGPQMLLVEPRVQEIQRQKDRLKTASDFEIKDEEAAKVWKNSINNTMSLLSSLQLSRLEIPMASLGQEQNASLYFSQNGIYGDLEIRDNEIEYYLRSEDGDEVNELSGIEKIPENKTLPANLLVYLWKKTNR